MVLRSENVNWFSRSCSGDLGRWLIELGIRSILSNLIHSQALKDRFGRKVRVQSGISKEQSKTGSNTIMAILIADDKIKPDGVVELKRAEGLTLVLDTPKGSLSSTIFIMCF